MKEREKERKEKKTKEKRFQYKFHLQRLFQSIYPFGFPRLDKKQIDLSKYLQKQNINLKGYLALVPGKSRVTGDNRNYIQTLFRREESWLSRNKEFP